MRHTRAHTANRRSHHALKGARFVACKDCGAQQLMHRACQKCGKYRGRLVVDVLKKTVKAAKKKEGKKAASAKSSGEPKEAKKKEEPKTDKKEGVK